jgi:hypothetical protein
VPSPGIWCGNLENAQLLAIGVRRKATDAAISSVDVGYRKSVSPIWDEGSRQEAGGRSREADQKRSKISDLKSKNEKTKNENKSKDQNLKKELVG